MSTRLRFSPTSPHFSHAKNHLYFFKSLNILLLLLCLFSTRGYGADTDNLAQDTLTLAQKGDAQAQYSLFMMYDKGGLLPFDTQQSMYWLIKSAEQNLPAACLYLGMKYEFGNGVEKNKKKAIQWYRKAAQQHWPMAQYLLALLYLDEKETKKERILAAAWLQQARQQGYPGAKEKLNELLLQLTDEEKKLSARVELLRPKTIIK